MTLGGNLKNVGSCARWDTGTVHYSDRRTLIGYLLLRVRSPKTTNMAAVVLVFPTEARFYYDCPLGSCFSIQFLVVRTRVWKNTCDYTRSAGPLYCFKDSLTMQIRFAVSVGLNWTDCVGRALDINPLSRVICKAWLRL
ncbi:unnamed protein product, partial [Dicrocoelium dendriticum]